MKNKRKNNANLVKKMVTLSMAGAFCLTAFAITGCANSDSVQKEAMEQSEESENPEYKDISESEDTSESEDASEIEDTSESEDTSEGENIESNLPNTADDANGTDISYIIQDPDPTGKNGKLAIEESSKNVKPMTFTEISSENNVAIEDKWIQNNGLVDIQNMNEFPNEEATCEICDNLLYVTREEKTTTFDLSQFIEVDQGEFAEMEIHWTQVVDGVLYVSLYHMTYATDNTAYILAVDLESNNLIWKSQSLLCNCEDFIVHGDIIICGYGFTDEDDYLYQLNRYSGEVVSQMKVKSKPEYLCEKDGKLYVRCYDTDYIYQIEE